jgi:hypothetical protein
LYVYFISGAKNVQKVFRSSNSLSSDFLVLEVYRKVIGVPKRDLAIYEADKSGSSATPLTSISEEKRIWRQLHQVQHHHLSTSVPLIILTRVFTTEFEKIMDEIPLDEWTTLLVYKFVRTSMSTASTISLIGSGVFKENPNLIDDFWIYFEGFMALFMGLPRFMNPKVYEARERLTAACIKHLKSFEDKYDEIQKQDPDWDEDLGSKVNRLRDKALLDAGLSIEGRGAHLGGYLIGYTFLSHFFPFIFVSALFDRTILTTELSKRINGNAVPITCWIIIDAIRTPVLLASLREEISTTVSSSKKTGNVDFDVPKLLSLPLLSSVYTETLRLRISTTPTRQLLNDLEVDGLILKQGNAVMIPSWLAHTNSEWSTPEHPATSFWAERFLPSKASDKNSGINMTPKTGNYFPFGGGSSMCPGRFFAKQEILTAVAMFIWKFEVEFLEFVTMDGGKSDRGPELDRSTAGAGAVVPDRDLRVRLKRRL